MLGRQFGASGRRITFAAIGNAAYALAQLGVLVLITRAVPLSVVGQYALALAVCAPIHLGLGFRLRTARSVDSGEVSSLRTYVQLTIIGAATAFCIATVVAVVLFEPSQGRLIMIMVSLTKVVESFIDLHYGELQRVGDLRSIAKAQVLRAVLTICTIALALHWTKSVAVAVACSAAASALQLVVVERPWRVHSPVHSDGSHTQSVEELFKHVLPLGVAAGITSLTGAVPRLVVAAVLGDEALGIYAVLAYSVLIMNLLANSIGQALIGKMAEAARTSRGALLSIGALAGLMVLIVGLIGMTVLWAFGEVLLVGVFGAVFGDYVGVAIRLALAATAAGLATVAYYALSSTGDFKMHPVISGVTAVGMLPSVYFLTSAQGLSGAALGMFAAHSIQFVVTVVLVRGRLRSQG